MPPDQWARTNRKYPSTSGWPGPRKPELTPYVIPIAQVIWSGRFKRIVEVMGSQMGKTDGKLDIIGSRLDQRPVPILYVGPTRDFVADQFEPRVMQLLNEAATLSGKVIRGRRMKKTRKIVAGVPLRLAHGGSSSALKSDPAGLALVDEYDEMLANIKGQGDPLGLVEARGNTYADFVTSVASTPSQGLVETEVDPVSGLEFWRIADPEDLSSGIWKLFQEGTRYHWAWPCPHCNEYFIPRFKLLKWKKDATPAQARKNSWLDCPRCGCEIRDDKDGGVRKAMNERGVFVAPGQEIIDGIVTGEPVENSTWSAWVSGLASPFVTWGERAETYLKALNSGEEDKIQTAINAGFGECYAIGAGGDIPDWTKIKGKAQPYKQHEVPRSVLRVTMGVDVQKRSLYYVIRGWGSRGSSWLIDYGEILGHTDEDEVWDELTKLVLSPVGGLGIERVFIDSGFRPGKPEAGSDHKVYDYVRRFRGTVYATKGHDTQPAPIKASKIEVTPLGKKANYSLTILHLDSDFFKSGVHHRAMLEPGKPQSWHVPSDVTEEYCRQIVSEARVISRANGKPVWIVRNRQNHYLDCEALAFAAGYMLKVHTIPDGVLRDAGVDMIPEDLPPDPPEDPTPSAPSPAPAPAPKSSEPTKTLSARERFARMSGRINRR